MNPSLGTHNTETHQELRDAIVSQQRDIFYRLQKGEDVVLAPGDESNLARLDPSLYRTEPHAGWTQQPGLRILSATHPTEKGVKAFNRNDLGSLQEMKDHEAGRRRNSERVRRWRSLRQEPGAVIEFALVEPDGTVGPWTGNAAIAAGRIAERRAETDRTGMGHGWGGSIRSLVDGRSHRSSPLLAEELESVVAPFKLEPDALYAALHAATAEEIKSYRRDLEEHDRDWIMQNTDGEEFLHFTNPMGTSLVPLLRADSRHWPAPGQKVNFALGSAERDFILDTINDTVKGIRRSFDPHVIHHFDGARLRRISMEQAVDIARAHVGAVQAAWKGQDQSIYGNTSQAAETDGVTAYRPVPDPENPGASLSV